uniref:Uncharacterized protein n=1 Tax=Siphoviridae sp. ctneY2 TaxID=2825664 RepID=A0A8S5V755_9CAUD|nr:MAG TPA: hypothetical protein [Siphoviridae sp. ctneY2]
MLRLWAFPATPILTAETNCSAFSVNSLVCTSEIPALQSLG